jgi:hypothetical protein
MITTDGTVHGSQPGHGDDRKIFEVMITTWPLGTLSLLYPILANSLYQVNHDMNHNLWLSWDICTYSGAAGMLLHLNVSFVLRQLKSSLLS